jgi:hypothetical protein
MINHNHNRINKEIEVIEVIVAIEEEERTIVMPQVIKILKMFILIYDILFFNAIYLYLYINCDYILFIFFLNFKSFLIVSLDHINFLRLYVYKYILLSILFIIT